MPIYLLFLSILLPLAGLSAQRTVTATVIDAVSREPVPYVNVGLAGQPRGTVSDHEGSFTLKGLSQTESLRLSALGYESRMIRITDLANNGEIVLTPVSYGTDTVRVVATRFAGEEKMFGVRNDTRGHSIGFGNAELGTEVGSVVKIDRPTYVKSAHFVLNHAKGDSMMFRLHLYRFEDGEIGGELLTENVFIKDRQQRGTVAVDLTHLGLVIEDNVLLTLEWIRNFSAGGNEGITFDTKKGGKHSGIYYKLYSNGELARSTRKTAYNVCFYLIGKQAN